MSDTKLTWPGKKTEVDRIILPFQTVEVINKPREKQNNYLKIGLRIIQRTGKIC